MVVVVVEEEVVVGRGSSSTVAVVVVVVVAVVRKSARCMKMVLLGPPQTCTVSGLKRQVDKWHLFHAYVDFPSEQKIGVNKKLVRESEKLERNTDDFWS